MIGIQSINKYLKNYGLVILAVAFFVVYKISNLAFHFGDGNAYMYMGQAILNGQMPYRDFFLADPPFMVLLVALVKWLVGDRVIVLQALPVLFEAGSALLIYKLLKDKGVKLAYLAPLAYLFSFTILSTSDFLTGVQLAVFMMLCGIYLESRGKYFWSGIFWSGALLTKAYMAPAWLGFELALWLNKKRKEASVVLLGMAAGGVVVMAPFLLVSWVDVWRDTFLMHLNRPGGLSKEAVFGFFFWHEWLAFILAVLGGYFCRKRREIILPMIFLFVFFVFFKDIYYAYLASFYSLMAMTGVLVLSRLEEVSSKIRIIYFISMFVWIIFLAGSFLEYKQNFAILSRFTNAEEVAAYVAGLPEGAKIYGSHEVVPLVALLSGKKIFDNHIDTNTQLFASNALDLQAISEKAAAEDTYLLAKITDIPELDVRDHGYQGYFKEEVFNKYCQRKKEFPSTSREQDNLIVIYECKH